MKKLSLLIIAVASLNISVTAQKKIEVKESNESFSTGNQNALSVVVYGGNISDVEKAWKKQLKDMKGNTKSSKGEIFADDCRIKKMSDNTFDVYSKFQEVDEGVRVIAGVDLGGAYLNSSEHKEFFPYIKEVMYEFGVEQTKAVIGNTLKEEQKKLDELVDDKEDMEKNIEDMKKEIEDYKKRIQENEKKIEETKKEIETKTGEIKTQETVVKEVQEKQNAVK